MRQRHPTIWPAVVLVPLVLAGLAADGAAYTRSTNQPPSPADLLVNTTDSKTLPVVLINLTPYTMSQPGLYSMAYQTNTDRGTKKSFMFAPVGVPGDGLPPLEGTWATDPTNSTCKEFHPVNPNTSLHPYSMAFSFDDRDGTVKEGHHTIRLENVWQDYCHESAKQNVDIGLFFSRFDPDKKLQAEVLKEIVDAVKFFAQTISLSVTGGSPIAWLRYVACVTELATNTFQTTNAADDHTMKVYFAAYPIPDPGSPADTSVSDKAPGALTECLGCGSGETSDGADAGWNAGQSGNYAANIVVTTYVLRSQDSTDPKSANVAFVALWMYDLYYTAMTGSASSAFQRDPVGRRIHSTLATHNREKFLQYARLMRSLTPEQRETYVSIHNALRRHHSLDADQKVLLKNIAEAFEKGHGSLKEATDRARANRRGEGSGNVPHKP